MVFQDIHKAGSGRISAVGEGVTVGVGDTVGVGEMVGVGVMVGDEAGVGVCSLVEVAGAGNDWAVSPGALAVLACVNRTLWEGISAVPAEDVNEVGPGPADCEQANRAVAVIHITARRLIELGI